MIILPSDPAPRSAEPGIVDFGGFLTPFLGGEVQRIDRMGNRFKIAVEMPPMPSDDLGRVWVSRLIRGKTEGARLEFPLGSFDPGNPGAPAVNGGGQSGRLLSARGFNPGYQVREGQWFSLVRAGRRYLHNVDAAALAAGDGTVQLSISPMLRIEPADGDVLEFAKPYVEGWIHGQEWSWRLSLELSIGIAFEIAERA